MTITSDKTVDEFKRRFDRVSLGRNRYEVWQDFITLTACGIAAAADPRPERDSLYQHTIGKYRENEAEWFARTAAAYFEIVEKNPFQDVLGELYMKMELGNNYAGQFFTPYHISQMMAEMNAEHMIERIERDGWTSVNDCACGGGAMLIAAAEALCRRGINYQQTCMFVGQDLIGGTAMMCYIQLSMLGCPGYVKIGDTLREPATGDVLFAPDEESIWVTPMYNNATWSGRRFARILDDAMKRERRRHDA